MSVRVERWSVAVRCALACPAVCYICSKAPPEGCINGLCPGGCAFLVMACGHGYHAHCISPTNTGVCYVCRAPLSRAEIPDETLKQSTRREFLV